MQSFNDCAENQQEILALKSYLRCKGNHFIYFL